MDFESLLRARVIAPLKLTGTATTPSPKMKARLAVGHDAVLQPSGSFFTVPIHAGMAAAGGLVSTANDVLTFLAAAMATSVRHWLPRWPPCWARAVRCHSVGRRKHWAGW
jgi:CubicO group peptidase (beta-lactamase class C family)